MAFATESNLSLLPKDFLISARRSRLLQRYGQSDDEAKPQATQEEDRQEARCLQKLVVLNQHILVSEQQRTFEHSILLQEVL